MVNYCIDCGKEKKSSNGKRCGSCAKKGNRHPRWSGKYPLESYCIDCGKEIHRRSKRCRSCAGRHLSIVGLRPHSDDHKEKIRKTKTGQKRSESTKKKLRQIALDHIQNNPGPWKDTKPELKLEDKLILLGISYEKQFRVPGINHLFDFHLLNTNMVVEVDGDYWHSPSKRPGQRKKDYKINRLAKQKGFKVIRFWEKEIMENEEKVVNKLRRI